MMPIVDGLTDEFEGDVAVLRLDAIEPANMRLQTQYGLRGHPSFAILDANGQVVERFLGPQTAGTLRQAMEAVTS